MKKLIACVLAIVMLASITMVAYANNVTHLTTTVPDATYTLNIPADQEIEFGTSGKLLGTVTVTESSGFAVGKNVRVIVEHTDFISEDVSTTIPYELLAKYSNDVAGEKESEIPQEGLIFYGNRDGAVDEYPILDRRVEGLILTVENSDWGKALGGDYHSEITFTAEVVVGITR